MMNFAPPTGHSEGQSTIRPPLFNGSHFIWWKARMETFLQNVDYELWNRITDGPIIPMKIVDGEQVKKTRSEFTPEDLVALKKNAKAKNILVCGLSLTEYNRVSNCNTAKQIWDALVNAHEGTSQVRKFKIALLFTEYEAFEMGKNESLQEMITRLTLLVNELSSLGKVLSTEEQEKKVLRVRPKSKWNVKVTAIREAKDLIRMSLDELVGNLKTYEMDMEDLNRSFESDESDDETALMAIGDSDME
ncbi:uncharacterized protein LOC124899274 [Capsicum annuum]|uniref:uncharacterized protein LOC124899274 n=1 Tax=Capsicum annuum TaxID=4072 RepID=UPI001FB0B1AA|nr:uncharacterized protein LOC124899274 [Capsicum annuum]XP_047269541.1 uncharacterized protein LOC124899274 [Capsicum annuum]